MPHTFKNVYLDRMRQFFSALLIVPLLILAACSSEPTIDGSSPAAAEASISEVRESLDEDEQRAFDQSFEIIVRDEIHKNLDDLSGDASEELIIGHVIERLDGKTGSEVIEKGSELSGEGVEPVEPDQAQFQ